MYEPQQDNAQLAEAREYAASIRPGVTVTDIVAWYCAGDNYEPVPRSYFYGWAVEYRNEQGDTCYRVTGLETKDIQVIANGGVFVVDDGATARPYYSAGFNLSPDSEKYPLAGTTPYGLIHPFPVNHVTATGYPANFDSWMLGPRKCYHLKIQRIGLQA